MFLEWTCFIAKNVAYCHTCHTYVLAKFHASSAEIFAWES